jgi:hypothetical protein
MKLLSIAVSDDNKHKYVAVFDNDGRKKTVRFGSKGMDDYTLTHDKEQRERYRKRHEKDLKGDPSRAGYLSYYILWGDSTDINTNIRKYVRMFNL